MAAVEEEGESMSACARCLGGLPVKDCSKMRLRGEHQHALLHVHFWWSPWKQSREKQM